MKGPNTHLFVVAFVAVAFWFAPGMIQAAIYNEVRITYNEYNDAYPWINGNKIVWQGWDMFDYEIYCYDIVSGQTTEITHNVLNDKYPIIKGNLILWVYGEDPESEWGSLFLHDLDAGQTIQLSDEPAYFYERYDGGFVDGDLVVWRESGGRGMLYDHSAGLTTQLVEDIVWAPQVSQGRVVWVQEPGTGSYQIYLHDVGSGETTEVYSTSNWIDNIAFHGNRIAWMELVAPETIDLFVLDLTTAEILQITDGFHNIALVLGENGVVFHADELPNPPWADALYYHDFQSGITSIVTDDEDIEFWSLFDIDGDDIVWQGPLVGQDIFHYDTRTGETTAVTRDIFTDENPKIDNGLIVWRGYDYSSEHYEIYLGVPCLDADEDGYEDASCGGTDCNDSNPDVNPGTLEIPGNGIDDDCNPLTPAYPEPANTIAASYGSNSLTGSGVFNQLGLLFIPIGAVLLLRILRRNR